MSNVFLIIKLCYVHNQWYDISCATLYINERIQKYSTNNTKHSIYKYTYYENTHTLQNKLKQPQHKIHTKLNSHNTIKYPRYKVTLMYMVIYPQELHRNSLQFTSLVLLVKIISVASRFVIHFR